MNIERSRRHKPRIDVVPMIDVIFFLLVFFMMFTTFRTETAGINVDLPRAVTGESGEDSRIVITVDENGTKFLGGRSVTSPQLQEAIEEAIEENPDAFIVIRGDRDAKYDYIVEAIDDVRAVGGYRLGLAVELEK